MRDEVEGKVLEQGTPQGFPVGPGAVIVVAVPSSAQASGNTAANPKADSFLRVVDFSTRLWTAAVLLELVDARKGHVVWAGNLQSSAVDDANEPALNGGAPRR